MRLPAAILLAAAALALASCRLVATSEVLAHAKGKGAAAFDPDTMVAGMWAAKVVPYLDKKAGGFAEVRALASKDPAAAGARFGHREDSDGAPWTYVVRLEGTVIAANLESRAASIEVDATGGGKADATVQIGPVIRGTALRDALDFVKFGDFTNQIEFAQFGKAFNAHVQRTALEKLPRDALVGKRVRVLGAYTATPGGSPPLVTPASLEIEAVQ